MVYTGDNRFYVYVYLDPRKPGDFNYDEYHFDYEPIYIGKGSNNKQHLRHLREAKNNRIVKNSIKFYKIKHILQLGLEPIIFKLHENITEEQSFELEKKLIQTLGRISIKSGPLTNLNDGGNGGQSNPSPELRIKFGMPTKGKTYEEIYGKKKAKELKNKRIESNKKRNIRKDINTNIPEKLKILTKEQEKMFNTNGAKNPNIKKWKLINPENEIIITINLKHACKEFNLGVQMMSKMCRGIIDYYKGWRGEILDN